MATFKTYNAGSSQNRRQCRQHSARTPSVSTAKNASQLSNCALQAPEIPRRETAACASAPDIVKTWPVGINTKCPLFVSFAGGGIYFFWQLGAMKYLRERYDLTRVPMAGASAGSLVACLSACGIDPQRILDEAYQLSIDNDIWNRKFGLLGIWGNLIRDWLDKLLPENAHELVSGRLHVIIAKAPTLELFEVTQFESKKDLIEAVMASAHVPFVLDGRPFLKFRERLCWDGSFPDFFYFQNSDFLTRDDTTLIVDYSMDEQLDWTRGDFLKLRSYDEIMELMEKGYKYMARQHEEGVVAARFATAPVEAGRL